MPADPTPEGQGSRNPPQVKPFPQPTPTPSDREPVEQTSAGEGASPDSMVTPDMEEPAETNRPPLGN